MKRLLQELVRLAEFAPQRRFLVAVAGNEHDAHRGPFGREAAQAEFQAAESGHDHVGQQEVDGVVVFVGHVPFASAPWRASSTA